MLAVLEGSHADAGAVMECQCALIETMYDYCPREGRTWWPSTAKHVASQGPAPRSMSHRIPRSMSHRKDACFPRGICDSGGRPGSGSPLFYINTWAMIWPTDYPA